MKQLSLASFPCVCVLSLFLATPALAGAKDTKRVLGEGADAPTAQLIGWSQDEQRFVFRVYSVHYGSEDLDTDEDAPKDPWRGKDGFCKGYVNHESKPFNGSLEFQVFERSGQVAVLPIQDNGRCTPPKTAAQRLAEAKKQLAGLGISLERRGAVLLPKDGKMRLEVKAGTRAPYTLEFINDTETEDLEDNGMARLHGTMRLLMHSGGKQQVLWEKKINEEYESYSGFKLSLSQVDVSPSGGRLVMLHRVEQDAPRDGYGRLWVEAVLDVPGDATAKAE
jgi:hypothetical protein